MRFANIVVYFYCKESEFLVQQEKQDFNGEFSIVAAISFVGVIFEELFEDMLRVASGS